MAVVNAFVSPLGNARRPMPAPPTTDMAMAGPNMARQNAFAATVVKPQAPTPAGIPAQNAFNAHPVAPTPNPFAISQPQNPGPMANAFRGFATGLLGVDKVNAIDDRYKAQDAEAGKKNLAMLQQFRAMPVEQRMAALPQLSQAIGKQIPQEVMSDQAIDAQLAVMQGQLGIAPDKPKPMSAYEAKMAALKEAEAGRPTTFNLGDGALGEYDPNADPGKRLNMLRQPTTKPADLPEGMWYGHDGKGQPQPIPGYESMKGRIAAAGRAPGDGSPKVSLGYREKADGTGWEPIPGGPGDPMRSGVEINPQIIAMETAQSSKWMPIQKDFQDIGSQYKRIETLAKRDDSAGDLGLVVSFTKMLDPGSVARESEVEMTQSAAGALQQAAMWLPRLQDGKTKLPPEVRKMFVSAANDMYGVYEGAYNGLAQDMQSRLTQYGLSPERVMLGYEPPAPTGAKVAQTPAMQMGVRAYAQQTGIPAEAITEFLSNPATPQEIAEFNEAFKHLGANQAEAILKALRSGR